MEDTVEPPASDKNAKIIWSLLGGGRLRELKPNWVEFFALLLQK